jgi:hypothetical protein
MDGEAAALRINALRRAPSADVVMLKLEYYWAS